MDQNKFDILKTELLLTQQQMDKYDQLSTTIKTWAVTLWVASSGWALQTDKKTIFVLGIMLVVVFWFFDGLNKTFRTNYKKRRDEVAEILREFFNDGKVNKDVQTPQLPAYNLQGLFENTIAPHISIPYLFFIAVSIVLLFV